MARVSAGFLVVDVCGLLEYCMNV